LKKLSDAGSSALPFEDLFDYLKRQTLYYDTHTCPPMIIQRERCEGRAGAGGLRGAAAAQDSEEVEP
jgi:hypothetical protein